MQHKGEETENGITWEIQCKNVLKKCYIYIQYIYVKLLRTFVYLVAF
jgi:hypothetical protein